MHADANGHLIARRRLEVDRMLLPPERYDAFREFWTNVFRADVSQVVLVQQ